MTTRSSLRIWSVLGNGQRLDGGAMFGNAPRALWQRWMRPDANNSIELACRAMLVRETTADHRKSRHMLFEAGIGAFMSPKMKQRYGVTSPSKHVLLESLASIGLTHQDIDVIALSHLHFDHAGGLLAAYDEDKGDGDGGDIRLLFPNADFVVGAKALQRARLPHLRDRASFIEGLPEALDKTGRLHVVEDGETKCELLGDDVRLHWSNGHTPGMMLSEIGADGSSVVFAADLVPATPWMHVPITMGYDRAPEFIVDEKQQLLHMWHSRNARLFFAHDPDVALAHISIDPHNKRLIPDHTVQVAEALEITPISTT